MHLACFCSEFSVAAKVEFSDLSEKAVSQKPRNPDQNSFGRINSSFFHGAFRKYSATLEEKNYILKVQQPEYPELPAVEYLSNQIAKSVGISVAPFHLIRFQNQALTFVTRNLLDEHKPATLDHIYKFLPDNSRFDCETLVHSILSATGRLAEVHRLVEICLFDSLIGNHDRHGRNLAYLTKSGGTRILSPFYDNPSYIGIADELLLGSDLQPKGTIFTQDSEEPTTKNYIMEFRRLQLETAVTAARAKIVSKTSQIFRICNSYPFLSEKRKKALIRLIEVRLSELENG
jgi:hypothetical protein